MEDRKGKAKKKGFLFSIGDEPNLRNLPARSIKELMGVDEAKSYTDVELLEAAQKTYNVYHIVVMHSSQAKNSLKYWKNILGQNCIEVDDHTKVANTIAEIVCSNNESPVESEPAVIGTAIVVDSPKDEEIL